MAEKYYKLKFKADCGKDACWGDVSLKADSQNLEIIDKGIDTYGRKINSFLKKTDDKGNYDLRFQLICNYSSCWGDIPLKAYNENLELVKNKISLSGINIESKLESLNPEEGKTLEKKYKNYPWFI